MIWVQQMRNLTNARHEADGRSSECIAMSYLLINKQEVASRKHETTLFCSGDENKRLIDVRFTSFCGIDG